MFPAAIYLFKVSNRNTKTRCKISLKLTIKTTERRHCRRSCVFIVNFELVIVDWVVCTVSFKHIRHINLTFDRVEFNSQFYWKKFSSCFKKKLRSIENININQSNSFNCDFQISISSTGTKSYIVKTSIMVKGLIVFFSIRMSIGFISICCLVIPYLQNTKILSIDYEYANTISSTECLIHKMSIDKISELSLYNIQISCTILIFVTKLYCVWLRMIIGSWFWSVTLADVEAGF